MTPKEKASELFEKIRMGIWKNGNPHHINDHAKECALICVEELILSTHSYRWHQELGWDEISDEFTQNYWGKVKEEIQKL